MGMFDSIRDDSGAEWQTKAFHCEMDVYRLGDELPYIGTDTYQVEIFGGPEKPAEYIESYATIRNNKLASIHDERDGTIPLLDYHGGWTVKEQA